MPYLFDRQRALHERDIVAVIGIRQRRVRSRVILWDNGFYHTLTRPRTLLRRVNGHRSADNRDQVQCRARWELDRELLVSIEQRSKPPLPLREHDGEDR